MRGRFALLASARQWNSEATHRRRSTIWHRAVRKYMDWMRQGPAGRKEFSGGSEEFCAAGRALAYARWGGGVKTMIITSQDCNHTWALRQGLITQRLKYSSVRRLLQVRGAQREGAGAALDAQQVCYPTTPCQNPSALVVHDILVNQGHLTWQCKRF